MAPAARRRNGRRGLPAWLADNAGNPGLSMTGTALSKGIGMVASARGIRPR